MRWIYETYIAIEILSFLKPHLSQSEVIYKSHWSIFKLFKRRLPTFGLPSCRVNIQALLIFKAHYPLLNEWCQFISIVHMTIAGGDLLLQVETKNPINEERTWTWHSSIFSLKLFHINLKNATFCMPTRWR